MNVGLYRAAIAMRGQQQRLDSIASNLANVSTPGFKRRRTAAQEFVVDGSAGRTRGLRTREMVDFSQGNLVRTGREYDLALQGEGFFALDGPDGELYTRDGSFHTNEDGLLVTDGGVPVAWESRSATIDPTGLPISVDVDGTVRQGENRIGRLRLVDFENKGLLRQRGDGLWLAPADAREATRTAVVHQFALEESNAVGTEEVIDMIGVQRAFETTANLVKSVQRSYSRLTRSF